MFDGGGVRGREEILRDVMRLFHDGTDKWRERPLEESGKRYGGNGSEPRASRDSGGASLSDEVDGNGRQFVLSGDGKLEFGEIGADTGLSPAPILLSEGMITDPETNDGYGLVHIEARHGDQIRNAGYKSVVEFVSEVAKNYEVIRKGKNRRGNPTYLLQLTDRHNNTLMVELSKGGKYWDINTAGIFKTSYGAKGDVVHNRHTTVKQSAETAGVSLSGAQSGTTPSTSMNTPTVDMSSVGKDSESIAEKQGGRENLPIAGSSPPWMRWSGHPGRSGAVGTPWERLRPGRGSRRAWARTSWRTPPASCHRSTVSR